MEDVKAMYREAFGAFARGEHDEAIAGYKKVVEADPAFGLAYQGMAEAYARMDALEDAVVAIEKAIEADPEEPLYHTRLSRFLQRLGKIPEAEAEAAEAQRIQDTSDR